MKNTSVCNAKFNVGDYVEVVLPTSPLKGRVGRICAIDTSNKAWPYEVYFSDRGSSGKYGEKEIAKAYNSTACNAKFKVGDKVIVTTDKNDKVRATIAKVGKVVLGKQVYQVVGETEGASSVFEEDMTLANSRAINSTNPVVRKAMNTVAKNSTEDLQILLSVADTNIDDGDIDEAKQILRETKTRAIRAGYIKEWKDVAKRVGMNSVATNDKDGANFVLRMMSGVYATIANLRGSSGDQKLDSMLDQLYKLATEIKAEAMKQSH